MKNNPILFSACLVSMILPGFLVSQNRSILLWNGSYDSVVVKSRDNIVIGINNKTCKDCLRDLINSLQTKPTIITIWITLQTSQSTLVKRSIRNDLKNVSAECSKCSFFISNNLNDSLLNANIQTPIVFKQHDPALKIYKFGDCFEYGLVKKEFLQKITE